MPKKAIPQGIKIQLPKTNSSNRDSNSPTLRLNKAIAHAGYCSRRAADELIASNKVSVNGEPAQAGQQINIDLDKIVINGYPIDFENKNEQHIYIILNKPIQVVCTVKDPQKRETVLDIIPEKWLKSRLYPVGRLDFFSEGLLLLTNDGELTFRLTHPGWHVPRVYEVKIRGDVSENQITEIRSGMTLAEGENLAPIQAQITKTNDGNTLLELTLHQGINRQIRRMCRDFGLTILSLRRIKMGTLSLGNLPKGESRLLENCEISALRKALELE